MNAARRRCAAAFALVAAACGGGDATAPAPGSSFIAQFDAVWTRYDSTYAYFEYKGVNWDSLRVVYRPRAASATSPDQLRAVLREMLGSLRDVHAWLVAPDGSTVPTYTPTKSVNWRQSVWRSYLQRSGWQPQPTNWGYARLGAIPILYFGQWNPSQFSSGAVDVVLEQFRDAPAIIIDVRMNGGGDESLALAVASRFYDSTRVFAYGQERSGPRHSDLGPLRPTIVAPRGAWQFTRPILLLVGRGSFSSTEDFVAAMRLLPHVTIAGDTTGGGSGNPGLYPLDGGWKYTVPRRIEYTAAMQVIEWQGIAPDVVVPVADADWTAGRDPVLEFAARWADGRASANRLR